MNSTNFLLATRYHNQDGIVFKPVCTCRYEHVYITNIIFKLDKLYFKLYTEPLQNVQNLIHELCNMSRLNLSLQFVILKKANEKIDFTESKTFKVFNQMYNTSI